MVLFLMTTVILLLCVVILFKFYKINYNLIQSHKTFLELKDLLLNENSRTRTEILSNLISAIDTKLSESFRTVNQSLEGVYKGIGDIQKLATEVGDLKRVLSNVKQRGIFGEVLLKNILDDIIPMQYLENVEIKKGKVVEFAVKIPSKKENDGYILLPIDSKFPVEDYKRVVEARQNADSILLDNALKGLSGVVIKSAKDIKEYINPPLTTDFALMFLPSESIFAEVLSIDGLFEKVRRDYGVIITGPTTITAILMSFQVGFKMLSVEQKANEVWKIVSAFKNDMLRFSEYLDKAKKKIEDAMYDIENAFMIGKTIERKLIGVESVERVNKD